LSAIPLDFTGRSNKLTNNSKTSPATRHGNRPIPPPRTDIRITVTVVGVIAREVIYSYRDGVTPLRSETDFTVVRATRPVSLVSGRGSLVRWTPMEYYKRKCRQEIRASKAASKYDAVGQYCFVTKTRFGTIAKLVYSSRVRQTITRHGYKTRADSSVFEYRSRVCNSVPPFFTSPLSLKKCSNRTKTYNAKCTGLRFVFEESTGSRLKGFITNVRRECRRTTTGGLSGMWSSRPNQPASSRAYFA